MSRGQAEDARTHGYLGNLLWGRDYPHVEGTFHPPDDPRAEPMTQVALRHVLSVVPPEDRAMVAGETLVKVFGLDRDKLARVAASIGAPSADALGRAPDAIPEVLPGSNAFLGHSGPWQDDRCG